jgi:xanthine dehydrogenase accessory factor
VAIAAELIQLRWGGSGQPLTGTTGRIHHGEVPAESALATERTA